MLRNLMLTLSGVVTAVSLMAAPVSGQYSFLNVDLSSQVTLSQFGTGAANGNDCWGYTSASGREYALMGLSNAVAVVEVTDPANPVVLNTIPHTDSLWGDIKVFGDYAYAVNEGGGGIDIIDLSNVDNGVATLVRRFTGNSVRTSHNVVINEESGYLYLVGANINGGAPVAFDLNGDPTNPVLAGQMRGSPYCHDAQVYTYTEGPYDGREIAFCANGTSGVQIWDVTDKSNMLLLSARTYPGLQYCHQCWLSDDQQYLFVNDELDELSGTALTTRTLVFDVSDLENPFLATTFTSGLPSTDHNLYVKNFFVYEANYTSGLRIFDASNALDAFEVGFFDTYPSSNGAGFDGAWSCYPYFESGKVIISDLSRGLFVVDASAAVSGLTINYPLGRPEVISPSGGALLQIEIVERDASYQSGSATLHVDNGTGFVEIPFTDIGGGLFEAAFPPSECGDALRYYVSAESTDARLFTSPSTAPIDSWSVISAFGLNSLFEDDFETNQGWTVRNSNVSDGAWERGVPVGNSGGRGDPPSDFDGSGRCYVTGLGPDEDLDGGPTEVESPTFAVETENAFIRAALWFTSDDGDDELEVELSNDDGSSWVTVETITATNGWELKQYRVGDYITPTNTMRMRFSASDRPNNSVTEAGLDAFSVIEPECGDPFLLTADPLFANRDANLYVTGATPRETVYFAYSLRGKGSSFVPSLNVVLDLDRAQLGGTAVANNDGEASIERRVPNIGTPRLIWLQAAEPNRVTNLLVEQIN
ncbi:MAG: choice-of-anchor B family protein [Phycisphaerales bacterium]